jgi:hypothetical protein
MIKKTAIFLTSVFVVTLVTCALRLTSVAMSSFPQNAKQFSSDEPRHQHSR